MFETPRITILEYELIINKKLYDQGVLNNNMMKFVKLFMRKLIVVVKR